MQIGFTLRFVPQLLVEDFNKDEQEAGQLAGLFSFYNDFILFIMAPIAGLLYDIWYRKGITLIALIGCGLILASISFVTTLYPGFLLLNMAFAAFLEPICNSPLYSDYVAPEAMVSTVAFISLF